MYPFQIASMFAVCLIFCALFCWVLSAGVQKEKKVDLTLQERNLLETVSKIPSGVWGFIELGAIALIKTRFYHLIGWIWPSSNRIATGLCLRFSVKMDCSTETTQGSIATSSTLGTAHLLKQGYLFSVRSRERSWGSKQTSLNTIYHWNQQCVCWFLFYFYFLDYP